MRISRIIQIFTLQTMLILLIIVAASSIAYAESLPERVCQKEAAIKKQV